MGLPAALQSIDCETRTRRVALPRLVGVGLVLVLGVLGLRPGLTVRLGMAAR